MDNRYRELTVYVSVLDCFTRLDQTSHLMLSVFYSLKYASWQLAALFLGPVPGGRFNKTSTLKINSEFITSEIAISVPEQLIREVRGTLSMFEMYVMCRCNCTQISEHE